MRKIVPDILTLKQHQNHLKYHLEDYYPDQCDHCGSTDFKHHGYYGRKADRCSAAANNLNPILIPRFKCQGCGRTTSSLPEALPERHWYSWPDKQRVLQACVNVTCLLVIAKQMCFKPSRSTIRRWWQHLVSRWSDYRQVLIDLGAFVKQGLSCLLITFQLLF